MNERFWTVFQQKNVVNSELWSIRNCEIKDDKKPIIESRERGKEKYKWINGNCLDNLNGKKVRGKDSDRSDL